MEKANTNTSKKEISVIKMLDAPIELVWEAWTNPELITHWWGPNGFTSTIHSMEVWAEGKWRLTMHGPDGKNYNNKSVFKEIVPLKKIVFQHFNPDYTATILFEPKEKQTLLN